MPGWKEVSEFVLKYDYCCGRGVSDGTVDGVANFLELNYRQLDNGSNVSCFAQQGGVYRTPDGVFHKNMSTDFDDPRVRAEYRFPPRNLTDCYHILRYKEHVGLSSGNRSLHSSFSPNPYSESWV